MMKLSKNQGPCMEDFIEHDCMDYLFALTGLFSTSTLQSLTAYCSVHDPV